MTAILLQVDDRIVTLDYGQFCLVGTAGQSGDYMAYLETAIAGAGIAGDDYAVVVCSPHQNNFEMPLRVEVWDGPPPNDQAEWDEVFRCGLVVGNEGLYYQSTIAQEVVFDVPASTYSVLICGRGFVNRGWPGSVTPGDVWRVQMWPSNDRPIPARVKIWPPPVPRYRG
ncbi:hypothetical protein [Dactylosporangium sp. NPDC051484]|uniref:hypothetical protein n=1 Tax=Dactylosporangium sp. NPDC051484 TaxID=3154942 RepID=UPI00344D3F38